MSKKAKNISQSCVDKKNNVNDEKNRAKIILGLCLGCAAIGVSGAVINQIKNKNDNAQQIATADSLNDTYPKVIANVNDYKNKATTESKKDLDGTKSLKVLEDGSSLHHDYNNRRIIKVDNNYNTQNRFTIKSDNEDDIIEFKDVFEFTNGDIVIFSEITTENNKSQLLVNRYDKDANFISFNKIDVDTYNIYCNTKSSEYVVTNRSNNSTRIYKFNLNGDMLLSIDMESANSIIQDVLFKESNLALLEYTEDTNGKYNTIVELDSSGKEISKLKLDTEGFASNIELALDGDYLVMLQKESNDETISNLQTILTKVSKDGKLEWEKTTGATSTIEYLENVDNEYLVVMRDSYIQQNQETNVFYESTLFSVSKFDDKGETIWSLHLGDLRDGDEVSAFSETHDIQVYKNDTGIVITGFTTDINGKNISHFTLNIDKDGNIK